MTISYSGSFFRILLRWKGSIWKSVWKELLVFLILFYLIRFSVDPLLNYMDPSGIRSLKIKYKSMCSEFNEYTKLIPLTFLLGFYVSNVVSRWWHQFECLKWPEDLLSALCLVIPSKESRTARHQFARYVNLTAALAWRDVSSKIRLRFPQIENLIDVGLLTDRELSKLLSVNNSSPGVLWMTPLHWCQQILSGEVSAGRAQFQFMSAFTQELRAYRGSFRKLYCHDWVCVPLVYTQVAAISTYTYFFFCLFGRQKFGEEDSISSFPLFTIVQFLFFVGWFKVGQDLMRPFGLDDDDFELSYILDRNIITSFTIVDTLQDDAPPPFEEDVYWRYYRQSESSETKPNSNLKWGRVDLSRTSHKHPPKLHTFLEMKGLISSDDEKKGRKNKFVSW